MVRQGPYWSRMEVIPCRLSYHVPDHRTCQTNEKSLAVCARLSSSTFADPKRDWFLVR